MDACPDFYPELFDRLRNRHSAADRPGRAVKRGEEAITRGVCFSPPKPGEFLSHDRVIRVKNIAPGRVAKFRSGFGGSGHVEKEHGGENAIRGLRRALAGD